MTNTYTHNPYYKITKDLVNEQMKYQDLCKILKIEEKQGKARTLQYKQLGQYLDIERKGHNVYIREVYDNDSIELIESHGKYTTYIGNQLIRLLKDSVEREMSLSYREIMETLYLVNKRYYKGKYNTRRYVDDYTNKSPYVNEIDDYDLTLSSMNIFFATSSRILKNIIRDSVKSLERKSLLTANKSFRLYREVYTKDGESIIESKDCNKEEHETILSIQRDTVKYYNLYINKKSPLPTIQHIIALAGDEKSQLYTYMNEQTKQRLGYDRYTDIFTFILNRKGLSEEYNELLTFNKLNNNVSDKMLETKQLSSLNNKIKEELVDDFIRI